MIKRLAAMLVVFSLTIGHPAEATTTPGWLAPYFRDDAFDPTQLEWLRLAFVEGDDQAAPDLRQWLRARQAERATQIFAQLAPLGITGRLRPACFGDLACTWVEYGLSTAREFADWQSFHAALEKVRPYFQGYRLAVHHSIAAGAAPEDGSLRERILALRIGDQALRGLFGLGLDTTELPLNRREMRIFRMLIAMEMLRQNVRDLETLRRLVRVEEWPRRSVVGEAAATTVFLIVQHAVHDPAFQIRALRAMREAVEAREASPQHYALLYDRVMLLTTGRQRYGSQFVCRGGRYVADTMEDPTNIDRIRAEMGLGPLTTYAGTLPASC